MPLADIDVAVRREREMQRLPQEPLAPRLVPVAALSPDANRHQEPALRTELHHGVAVLVANPHVVLGVDGHPVRLVLMADHLVANRADQRVVLVELEQLRPALGIPLKGVQMPLRVDRDGRDTAAAFGERKGVREGEPHVRRSQFVRDEVALEAPAADRRVGARLGAAVARNRARPSAAGRRLLRAQARDCCEERDTENGHQEIAFHVSLLRDRRVRERAPLYLAMSQLRIDRIEDICAAAGTEKRRYADRDMA